MRKLALIALIVVFTLASAEPLQRWDRYTQLKGPGFALLVMKDGKVLRKEGFGFADLEKRTRITSATRFNLASNSKQFTAVAALLLERAGKLASGDPLGKFIPELPAYAKDIKVSDLIHHTSGLPDYMALCDSKQPITNKDMIGLLAKKSALEFPSGTQYAYSNTGYVLLSEVVERASGMPFYDFVHREIFKKLGMKASSVLRADGKDKIVHRAIGYTEWPFFERLDSSPCDHVYGDGGVMTSVEDYSKWLKALSSPGFLSESELKRIFTPGTLANGEPIPYAYGWALNTSLDAPLIFHNGAWLGFRSLAVYVPSEKLWVAVLSNYKSFSTWDLVRDLVSPKADPR